MRGGQSVAEPSPAGGIPNLTGLHCEGSTLPGDDMANKKKDKKEKKGK